MTNSSIFVKLSTLRCRCHKDVIDHSTWMGEGRGGELERDWQFLRTTIFLQPQVVQNISFHTTYSVFGVLLGFFARYFFTVFLCWSFFIVISQRSCPPHHPHQWNKFLLLGRSLCACLVSMPHGRSFENSCSFLVWITYLFWLFHG